jgi:hypothetical protein
VHCFAKLYKVMSVYCYFRRSMAYSAYLSIFGIFCILIIFLFVTARIDDGDETDDWEVKDHRSDRTGESVPLRADRWFQKDPSADPVMSSGNFSGIRINIWNRAKVRRFITHFLAGGGTHNRFTML